MSIGPVRILSYSANLFRQCPMKLVSKLQYIRQKHQKQQAEFGVDYMYTVIPSQKKGENNIPITCMIQIQFID